MKPALSFAIIAGAAFLISVSCGGGGHGGGSMTAPSTVTMSGAPPVFADEGGRFAGAQPAPVIVSGTSYVYQNTGTAGTAVQAASDGLV